VHWVVALSDHVLNVLLDFLLFLKLVGDVRPEVYNTVSIKQQQLIMCCYDLLKIVIRILGVFVGGILVIIADLIRLLHGSDDIAANTSESAADRCLEYVVLKVAFAVLLLALLVRDT